MKTPESVFMPITADLIETIRVWRNSPRVRENMLDDTEIGREQQGIWFASLEKQHDKLYKVFCQNSKPVGMLYFSDINNESCTWGCYIGEEAVWPGSGVLLSIAALDFAFLSLKVEVLNAEVFEENSSPIRMHKTFGYSTLRDKVVKTKSGREVTLKCFGYLKSDWLKNRENILSKLPKQIQHAANSIIFKK